MNLSELLQILQEKLCSAKLRTENGIFGISSFLRISASPKAQIPGHKFIINRRMPVKIESQLQTIIT